MICWFSPDQTLRTRGKYVIRHTTKAAKAIVRGIQYKVDINTLHKIETDLNIGMNDIARVQLRSSEPLFYDSYRRNRMTGSFVLIDEFTNKTVAAGMIR